MPRPQRRHPRHAIAAASPTPTSRSLRARGRAGCGSDRRAGCASRRRAGPRRRSSPDAGSAGARASSVDGGIAAPPGAGEARVRSAVVGLPGDVDALLDRERTPRSGPRSPAGGRLDLGLRALLRRGRLRSGARRPSVQAPVEGARLRSMWASTSRRAELRRAHGAAIARRRARRAPTRASSCIAWARSAPGRRRASTASVISVGARLRSPRRRSRGRRCAGPRASAASTASSTAAASAGIPSPSRSSIAAERKVASGFAMPVPAMSGAEPCTGSNTPGPLAAEARRGQHPERAGEHRRLVGEDVAEHVLGQDHVEARTGRRRAASPRCRPACGRARPPAYSAATASTVSRHSREVSSTFALSTEVTRPRRRARGLERDPGDPLDLGDRVDAGVVARGRRRGLRRRSRSRR